MTDEDDYSYVPVPGRTVGTLVPIERVEAARKEERERVLRVIEAELNDWAWSDEVLDEEAGIDELLQTIDGIIRRLREGT